jgi:hypothetical protein
VLAQYRLSKAGLRQPPDHVEIASLTGAPEPDWDALLASVKAVAPGFDGATNYHHAVESLPTASFYPCLDQPRREAKIHEGRKRIDISYTNVANRGFFDWVHRVHGAPAPNVFVECKNYGCDVANPEIDHSPEGFHPCGGGSGCCCTDAFGDKATLVRRRRDTALDDRGYIIALDDGDLGALVAERKRSSGSVGFEVLRMRFDELV